ncbi:Aromatic-ring-hydroxylating dioxygenase alpha subunit [Penicillium paradoxum]|uniref:Aromatic-ring-hydroxylating dioxygenase alpha subunit n=1 Tax=Penicillium paradoxum TaxID=176176 RepID=UPI0025488510|nr:Aromatic-ring-hydroxylating dioxygenase alpha subunit [Penicillium paradoxum]KAJ5788774.1 Aromatic-ring-hydroxylating dioxygenase alpha subunit [Penicillium paradoxum]
MSPQSSSRLWQTDTESAVVDANSTFRPLPASWYSSQDMYELERRAIFSRKWLLTTHKSRFPKTGDWLQYNICGYAFILVKDREGDINAFHNVCRHRAFPVVTEDGGTSRIFSCQYHGWSYGLNGKLAKAPGYQDLDGFDKSKNGLLPIHIHIDINGFIWVNLDAGEKPEISWENDSNETDLMPSFKSLELDDYRFDHAGELSGEYNWKILADIYHSRYHPGICDKVEDNSIFHNANSTPEKIVNGLKVTSTYCFPNILMTVSSHFFFIQRFVPTGPITCSTRYEVFRHTMSTDDDFEIIKQTLKSIMSEGKDDCITAQQSLKAEASVTIQPHPKENGRFQFQNVVRELIMAHHEREEEAGEEFWPARQRLPAEEEAGVSKEDMAFCSKVISKDGSSGISGGCCGGGCGGGPPTKPATAPETMVC